MDKLTPADHRQEALKQSVIFALKQTMVVYKKDAFLIWAGQWINDVDRAQSSALYAEEAAALDFQTADVLSFEWKAAKSAWEVAWAARLTSMGAKYRTHAKSAAKRAVEFARDAARSGGLPDQASVKKRKGNA
jgi:hypothetical protein